MIPLLKGSRSRKRKRWLISDFRLSVFYDVLFRPSLIPSADAWKRAWAWNGWGLCGKYAHAYCEEDFPCKYRPFRIKPVLPLHRQRDELDGRILYSICSLHSIESLIHLWIIQISQKSSITFGRIQRNDYLCTRWWVINGCRLSIRCSLKAIHSRMWNWVRLPIRNPDFPQIPRLPLSKEKLRIRTKLRKVEGKTKEFILFFAETE